MRYVFEGTSSRGCYNYALQKTDTGAIYGEQVPKTLLHIFYMDDLLKSVETEELAIRLIKNVRAVSQA